MLYINVECDAALDAFWRCKNFLAPQPAIKTKFKNKSTPGKQDINYTDNITYVVLIALLKTK